MSTPRTPTRTVIEKMLRDAEAAHARATEELANAQAQLTHAKERLDENKTTATRTAVVHAREDLESAERIEAKAKDTLERARASLAHLERQEQTEKYEKEKALVLALGPELAAHTAKLIELDKQIAVAIEAVARSVGLAANAHFEATRLASDLHMEADLARTTVRPELAEVRLGVQTALAKSRKAAERLDLSEWLVSAPDDWRLRGMSAAERRQVQEHGASVAREAEREADIHAGAMTLKQIQELERQKQAAKEGSAQ